MTLTTNIPSSKFYSSIASNPLLEPLLPLSHHQTQLLVLFLPHHTLQLSFWCCSYPFYNLQPLHWCRLPPYHNRQALYWCQFPPYIKSGAVIRLLTAFKCYMVQLYHVDMSRVLFPMLPAHKHIKTHNVLTYMTWRVITLH